MKYSDIQITNFRSIAELKLENFKKVNLITGRNNCGKTTVLEALFQISGMSNPQLPVAIHNFRDLSLKSDNDFNFIFRNLDFNQEPHISATLDGVKRDLIIKPEYTRNTEKVITNAKNNIIAERINTTNTDASSIVEGLALEFKDGSRNLNFKSEISLLNGMQGIDSRYKEKLRCSFYNPQLWMAMLPQKIEKLLVNKQMDGVIDALQEIDPKITDIRIGTSGIIYMDVGLNKLLPINIMGDGIRRILSILAAVSDMQGGILLIDEIENGLHYSTLQTLWKALRKALEVYYVQLFATTHSNECIGALASSCKRVDKKSEHIRLYRIEKQDNKHQAFEYSPEMISAGIDGDIEMR